MGDCTLWIKWLFLTECRQVSTHGKIGWASRSLNHSAGTNAKPCTWDRQTLWLLAQPEEQGPAKAWLSLSQSTALQQGEPGVDPQQHRQLSQGCHSTAPCDHRHTAPGRDLPVQDIRSWSEVRKRPLQHLPCENWGCWAPSACRTDSFGMRAEIAACCYLQGCYQENRPRLFTEVQGRRKKELKKTNVKSC